MLVSQVSDLLRFLSIKDSSLLFLASPHNSRDHAWFYDSIKRDEWASTAFFVLIEAVFHQYCITRYCKG